MNGIRVGLLFVLLVVVAGCGIASSSATASGGTGVGGPLCDSGSPTSLEGLSAQTDALDETTDTAALLEDARALRSELDAMTAGSDEIAEWREASIDAINQLERRIDDDERLPEVARHAGRTLRAFADRIC